ncbi:hypothetical protein OQA88_3821 [Cercophora sp. LCS_1]
MNNFGVIEVASAKTTRAPGWAYVPDVGPAPGQALQAPNRKRAARNQPSLSASDLTARQDAKLRKDLEALDRDTNKDVNIPIPQKQGASRTTSKHAPNVRKILQSQKTFANHLDDYKALLALAETNPSAAAAAAIKPLSIPTPPVRNSPAPTPKQQPPASKRSAAAAKRAAAKEAKEAAAAAAVPKPEPDSSQEKADDVEMTDAPPTEQQPVVVASYPPDGTILPAYKKAPPAAHPGDSDPLLVSRVPPFPTDEELRALMTAPPLSYLEARATWGEEEGKYPIR